MEEMMFTLKHYGMMVDDEPFEGYAIAWPSKRKSESLLDIRIKRKDQIIALYQAYITKAAPKVLQL